MPTRTRSNYRASEVRHLIEDYEELRELRDVRPGYPLRTLLSLVDIDKALMTLNLKERQAVLLCGQVGLTTRTAGVLVGASAMAMSRRYRSGLENLATYLNGAHDY